MTIDWNDVAVITCDNLSTVCLGLLAVGTIAGTPLVLPVPVTIALWIIGKMATQTLGHLRPVGYNRRREPSAQAGV